MATRLRAGVGAVSRTRPGDGLRVPPAVPIALAALAIVLVGYFDLQTNLPLLDETGRRWTIQRLVDGHGLVLFGFSPNFVESAVALPAALLHLEPRFWRLAGLPFLAMAGVFGWLIAVRFGANRFWGAVAAAMLVVNPIGLSLATGMMTETAFVGLLLAGTWLCLRWVTEGKSIGWAIMVVLLCTLQRQQGIALAVMTSAGFVFMRSRRPITRIDWIGLACLWVAVLAAFGAVVLIPLAPPGVDLTPRIDLTPNGRLRGGIYPYLAAVTALPLLGSLFLLPLVIGLMRRPGTEAGVRAWMGIPAVLLAACGLVWAFAGILLQAPDFYVGNTWGLSGLGPVTAGGIKPALWSLPIFLAVEELTVLTLVVVLVWRRRVWRPSVLGTEGLLVVILALVQFVVIPQHGEVYDRYFLPVVAPLIPLLAAVASRATSSGWAGLWAVAVMGGALVVFALGEQDYLAWQIARDKTAQLAYAQYPADAVDAGLEENVVHIGFPALEDTTGTLPRNLQKQPKVWLVFAPTDDPRPGFAYQSIAPGKIVIEVLNPTAIP